MEGLLNLKLVLLAGGNWNNGSNAGSQCRNANNYRWNTNSNIGRHFAELRITPILNRFSSLAWLAKQNTKQEARDG